jgi:hypothetical protein
MPGSFRLPSRSRGQCFGTFEAFSLSENKAGQTNSPKIKKRKKGCILLFKENAIVLGFLYSVIKNPSPDH